MCTKFKKKSDLTDRLSAELSITIYILINVFTPKLNE